MRQLADREEFPARYQSALSDFLVHGDESTLHEAYALGRTALESGFSLLDLVSLHYSASAALRDPAAARGPAASRHTLECGRFLLECLSPYEVLQSDCRGANAALKRLNVILEDEAKRIARALHDEAAQLLASAYLELAEIPRATREPRVGVHVARVTRQLDLVRQQLRRLSHELHPLVLDQLGLMPALEFLAEGYRKRDGLSISVHGILKRRLSPEAETAFYRIVQEALNNCNRHAHARHVAIRMHQAGRQVQCSVADDGVGFDPKTVLAKNCARGLGLVGMQERVTSLHGTFEIHSAPGSGTSVQASIPTAGRD